MESSIADVYAAGDCAETYHRLLGAQVVGHYGAEASKRLDVFATALFHGMRVADVELLDLSYTPPLGSPWDPVQISCMDWARAEPAQRGES